MARASRPWWRNPAVPTGLGVLIVALTTAVVLSTGHRRATPSGPPVGSGRQPVAASEICPLTGTSSPSGTVPRRPALAIKVDNYPEARPQSGLDQADVIYEEPVEGGVTRYVAVFQCQAPGSVGPVRSARYPDAAILDDLSHPIFVHVGGIQPILRMIYAADATDYDLFYRASYIQHPSGRVAPFDTYIAPGPVWSADTGGRRPPRPLFAYSATVPNAPRVATVRIPFSGTSQESWSWDQVSQRWTLSYSGLVDHLNDGAAMSVTNVVILHVQTSRGPWLENNVGGYEVEVDATAGGAMQLLRNGREVTGTWQRSGLGAPTQLIDGAGNPLPLEPGTTWVALVPQSVTVSSSS